jgi:hypothetical protein
MSEGGVIKDPPLSRLSFEFGFKRLKGESNYGFYNVSAFEES